MMKARERAAAALTERLRHQVAPGVVDPSGYVRDVASNLDGPMPAAVEHAFKSGAGQELFGKMRAPYSSSALAVNSFLPWAERYADLQLAGLTGFESLVFERQCATGLRGTAPHLDVVMSTSTHVLAVESKCLEYLTPKAPSFSDAYGTISDARARSRWFAHVRNPNASMQHVDVGQLVKHYLGLAREFEGKSVILLYLYWEPQNWAAIRECVEHRAELQRFAYSIAGDDVRFASLSYPELWAVWTSVSPQVAGHVARLRQRYEVAI